MSNVFGFIQISGTQNGALIVYDNCKSGTATIYALDAKGNKVQPFYADVQEFINDDGQKIFAAVFSSLPPGNYLTSQPDTESVGRKIVTVFSESITEVKYETDLPPHLVDTLLKVARGEIKLDKKN